MSSHPDQFGDHYGDHHRGQYRDHPLVHEYLRRLDAAGSGLPSSQREELLAEIRGHIAESLAGRRDEVSVRNVLQRLGSPEEIGAAARDDETPSGVARTVRVGPIEIGAVLLLGIGTVVLPGLGWLFGVWLLWTSTLWRTREKWLGSLLLPGCVAIFFTFPYLSSWLPGYSGLHMFVWMPVVLALSILLVPVYLLVVAARRARAGRAPQAPVAVAGVTA